MDGGRLGALLVQFPWSFRNDAENRAYLLRLLNRFAEYALAIEVRHGSWIEPSVLDELAELGVGLCNIDQPLFARSVKPTALTISHIGYVRLHGRNYRQWFSKTADVRERYDYLYTPEEMEPWVDRVKTIVYHAEETYVVANNHNLGKAVVDRRIHLGLGREKSAALIEVRWPSGRIADSKRRTRRPNIENRRTSLISNRKYLKSFSSSNRFLWSTHSKRDILPHTRGSVQRLVT